MQFRNIPYLGCLLALFMEHLLTISVYIANRNYDVFH